MVMARFLANSWSTVLLACLASVTVLQVQAEDYDIAILNGRVVDPETKLDAVRNVGIRDGSIVAVTERRLHTSATPAIWSRKVPSRRCRS